MRGMPTPLRRSLVFTFATILVTATLAYSQPTAPEPPPRIRPDTPEVRGLLDELLERSPTARQLVEHLQRSDVIVYVRHRWFATDSVDGHIGLLSSNSRQRFLIIELACRRTRLQQLATLGHELRHAVEIADETSVINSQSLSALYRRIGEWVNAGTALENYETNAAVAAGRRVRGELMEVPRAAHDAGAQNH